MCWRPSGGIQDVTRWELWIFVPLIAATLILGFYPAPALDVFGPAVANLVEHYQHAVGAPEAILLDGGGH